MSGTGPVDVKPGSLIERILVQNILLLFSRDHVEPYAENIGMLAEVFLGRSVGDQASRYYSSTICGSHLPRGSRHHGSVAHEPSLRRSDSNSAP